jgi:hypothetical protein
MAGQNPAESGVVALNVNPHSGSALALLDDPVKRQWLLRALHFQPIKRLLRF